MSSTAEVGRRPELTTFKYMANEPEAKDSFAEVKRLSLQVTLELGVH